LYAARVVGGGGVDGLRACADVGDGHAGVLLAGWLAARGEIDELRARAVAPGYLCWSGA
jgi:hypothetical protein